MDLDVGELLMPSADIHSFKHRFESSRLTQSVIAGTRSFLHLRFDVVLVPRMVITPVHLYGGEGLSESAG